MKRALITGGAGFIGSHLARRLLADQCEALTLLDSLEFGKWSNLGVPDPRASTVTADISDLSLEQMKEHLSGSEVLFHLAAQKHTYRLDSAEKVLNANVTATERLFRAAAAVGVRRIVFTSSLFAYGTMSGPAMKESDAAVPMTSYGVSKLAGEGLLRTVARDTGIESVSLRLFFIYGPQQFVGLGYPSVIVRTFDRILSGQAPTVYGDGEQSLDYVYIDDAVQALVAASRTEATGEVFNVATGTGVRVNDLLKAAAEVAGYSGPIESLPADWTAGTHRVGAPEKATQLLGWTATTPLLEGLRRTLRWVKETA